jgi:hypothetical protein
LSYKTTSPIIDLTDKDIDGIELTHINGINVMENHSKGYGVPDDLDEDISSSLDGYYSETSAPGSAQNPYQIDDDEEEPYSENGYDEQSDMDHSDSDTSLLESMSSPANVDKIRKYIDRIDSADEADEDIDEVDDFEEDALFKGDVEFQSGQGDPSSPQHDAQFLKFDDTSILDLKTQATAIPFGTALADVGPSIFPQANYIANPTWPSLNSPQYFSSFPELASNSAVPRMNGAKNRSMAIDRFLNDANIQEETARKRKVSIFEEDEQPKKYIGLTVQAKAASEGKVEAESRNVPSKEAAGMANAMVQTSGAPQDAAVEAETQTAEVPSTRSIKKPVSRLRSAARSAAKLTGVFVLGSVVAVAAMASLPDGFFAIE